MEKSKILDNLRENIAIENFKEINKKSERTKKY